MAKKVRRKLEEEEEASFEFPVFDEASFVKKEFALTGGIVLAGLIAIGLGFLGWVLVAGGLSGWLPFGLGILVLILSPYLIRWGRQHTSLYTKGDWAGLFALEFFGWLAFWFLLLNLSPTL